MLHQAGITSDQLDCMRHAQQQAGISAAAPTVSGAKHARIAEDDADAARRCRDLAMLIIMDQRTLQDLSARAISSLTARLMMVLHSKNHSDS